MMNYLKIVDFPIYKYSCLTKVYKMITSDFENEKYTAIFVDHKHGGDDSGELKKITRWHKAFASTYDDFYIGFDPKNPGRQQEIIQFVKTAGTYFLKSYDNFSSSLDRIIISENGKYIYAARQSNLYTDIFGINNPLRFKVDPSYMDPFSDYIATLPCASIIDNLAHILAIYRFVSPGVKWCTYDKKQWAFDPNEAMAAEVSPFECHEKENKELNDDKYIEGYKDGMLDTVKNFAKVIKTFSDK